MPTLYEIDPASLVGRKVRVTFNPPPGMEIEQAEGTITWHDPVNRSVTFAQERVRFGNSPWKRTPRVTGRPVRIIRIALVDILA